MGAVDATSGSRSMSWPVPRATAGCGSWRSSSSGTWLGASCAISGCVIIRLRSPRLSSTTSTLRDGNARIASAGHAPVRPLHRQGFTFPVVPLRERPGMIGAGAAGGEAGARAACGGAYVDQQPGGDDDLASCAGATGERGGQGGADRDAYNPRQGHARLALSSAGQISGPHSLLRRASVPARDVPRPST
jgi:hypothetical protein